MSTEDNKKQGLTDEAATVDLFNINKHLDGLSRFIKACNTPMTISIQGSWGSGKTSIMKMVGMRLKKMSFQCSLIPGSSLSLIQVTLQPFQ